MSGWETTLPPIPHAGRSGLPGLVEDPCSDESPVTCTFFVSGFTYKTSPHSRAGTSRVGAPCPQSRLLSHRLPGVQLTYSPRDSERILGASPLYRVEDALSPGLESRDTPGPTRGCPGCFGATSAPRTGPSMGQVLVSAGCQLVPGLLPWGLCLPVLESSCPHSQPCAKAPCCLAGGDTVTQRGQATCLSPLALVRDHPANTGWLRRPRGTVLAAHCGFWGHQQT